MRSPSRQMLGADGAGYTHEGAARAYPAGPSEADCYSLLVICV